MRILLVDDEPAALRFLQNAIRFTEVPCQIIGTAEDGKEALEKIALLMPDIVLTDVKMPGMDGISLAFEIRKQYPDILTIIISGYQDFEYLKSAIQSGVADYLLKPVGIDSLKELLTSLVDKVSEIHDNKHSDISKLEEGQKIDTPVFFGEITNYIEKNLAQSLTLGKLCDEIGISHSYASRLFQKYTGVAFTKYLTAKRIEAAKAYMERNPDLRVKDIAHKVGFPDPLYFSKVFHHVTGQTPSEFCMKNRK